VDEVEVATTHGFVETGCMVQPKPPKRLEDGSSSISQSERCEQR
jgi:hypothetical protein